MAACQCWTCSAHCEPQTYTARLAPMCSGHWHKLLGRQFHLCKTEQATSEVIVSHCPCCPVKHVDFALKDMVSGHAVDGLMVGLHNPSFFSNFNYSMTLWKCFVTVMRKISHNLPPGCFCLVLPPRLSKENQSLHATAAAGEKSGSLDTDSLGNMHCKYWQPRCCVHHFFPLLHQFLIKQELTGNSSAKRQSWFIPA